MALTTVNPNSRPIVTTETSGATGVSIAIDYTAQINRIATALETIASAVSGDSTSLISVLSDFVDLARTEGIKTQGVYDWVLLSSVYKIQVDDAGGIGLEKLTEYKGKIESLPKSTT
jgi:hypothetical protein